MRCLKRLIILYSATPSSKPESVLDSVVYSFQGLLSAQINALILFMELGVLISGVHFRGVLEREREIGGRIFGCDYEDTKTS